MGKPFNDDWMRERGFLDEGIITAKSIIDHKDLKQFVTIGKDAILQDAVRQMKELDISQIPITDGDDIVGSISESIVLSQILENPYNINNPVH